MLLIRPPGTSENHTLAGCSYPYRHGVFKFVFRDKLRARLRMRTLITRALS